MKTNEWAVPHAKCHCPVQFFLDPEGFRAQKSPVNHSCRIATIVSGLKCLNLGVPLVLIAVQFHWVRSVCVNIEAAFALCSAVPRRRDADRDMPGAW